MDHSSHTSHAAHASHETHAGHEAHASHEAHAGHGVGAPGGLQVAENGYRITPAAQIAAAGRSRVAFAILGPDGAPVTEFEEQHDKLLHLIVVRRDTSVFHHVHPTMDAGGTWTVEVDLEPGVWRLIADFTPAGVGAAMTLGADLSVPGEFAPRPIPGRSGVATIGDYAVTLAGELATGEARELRATVTRGGAPVTDLQPYLAAYGHLVAIRAGDLAYLHVHPEGDPADPATPAGPDIRFHALAPSAGTYRLFLDFRHDGVVRTADFTVEVDGAGPAPAVSAGHQHAGHQHGGDHH